MTSRHLCLLLLTLLAPLAVVAQDPKQEVNNQMWEAARKGDAVAVTAALDKGADVNAKFRYGTTALFKAAERGHTEVVKVLLARGADASVKDTFYGATAMGWALDNDHVEVVRAILDKDGSTVTQVLMQGARQGKAQLVEMAVAKGGLKPDALTSAYAAVMDDKEKAAIAEMLKKAGATPPLVLDAATLQSYVGRFTPETGAEIVFSVKEGRLFATPGPQQPIAMMALDKTTFKPAAFDGIVVTFTLEGEKVTGMTLKQGANTTVFKRVEEPKP
ncbi:MAG TPA: ankyrin repeat domain-containing protein [Pyrinomonadaceae bacterium]|nr:ankyrin repeat domain-containing protein [Pyrinomonadaceae bacterium]